jgi:hypothetical protein
MERLMLRLTGHGGAENDQVAHACKGSHQLLRRFARETVPDFERYGEVEAPHRWQWLTQVELPEFGNIDLQYARRNVCAVHAQDSRDPVQLKFVKPGTCAAARIHD